jgi:hypothetical protein
LVEDYVSIVAWILILNVRFETVKLIQEKVGNTLDNIGIENNFMNGITIAQQLIERINTRDYMKQKASAQQRKNSAD